MTRIAVFSAVALVIVVAIGMLARPILGRGGMLRPGAAAPEVAGQSVVRGKIAPFSLKDQLKHGAVVLYFFPAAFTSG